MLEIFDGAVSVQGIGRGVLNIAHKGFVRKVNVSFEENSIPKIDVQLS